MTRISTLLLTLVVAATVQAQTIANVVLSPATPTECDLVDINVVGTHPSSNFAASRLLLERGGKYVEPGLSCCVQRYVGSWSSRRSTSPCLRVAPWMRWQPPARLCLEPITNGGNDTNVVDMYNGTVTVIARTGADPGVDGFHTICKRAPTFPLDQPAREAPDTWGEWPGIPFGQPHGPDLVPGQDPAGLYTYLFDQNPPLLRHPFPSGDELPAQQRPRHGWALQHRETGSPGGPVHRTLRAGLIWAESRTGPNGTSFNGPTIRRRTNASGARTRTPFLHRSPRRPLAHRRAGGGGARGRARAERPQVVKRTRLVLYSVLQWERPPMANIASRWDSTSAPGPTWCSMP